MLEKYWSLIEESSYSYIKGLHNLNYVELNDLNEIDDKLLIIFETPDQIAKYFLDKTKDMGALIKNVNNYYNQIITLKHKNIEVKLVAKWHLELLEKLKLINNLELNLNENLQNENFPFDEPPFAEHIHLLLTKTILEIDPSIISKYIDLENKACLMGREVNHNYLINLYKKINNENNDLVFFKYVSNFSKKIKNLEGSLKQISDESSLILDDNNQLKSNLENQLLQILEYKDIEKAQREILLRYKKLYKLLIKNSN